MTPGVFLLVAVAALAAGMLAAFRAQRFSAFATCFGCAGLLASALPVLVGGMEWDWRPDLAVCGESVHLHLDPLNGLFLAMLAVIGGVGTVYSIEYWNEKEHPRSAFANRIWWNALILSLTGVLVTRNGLHFLAAWELFSVSAYFLITLDRRSAQTRAAGWLYLAASHTAMVFLLAFFSLLAARSGSWELESLRGRPEFAPLFWLALVGFGLKAGLFPLHVWLPSGHANAPSHVSAMLSGVTLKAGVYGLVRFSGWLETPGSAGWVLATLGAASAVLGVAYALGQTDFKRLLAYSSVENIGIILIGLGFAIVATKQNNAAWGRLALAGALLHACNHALFKPLLFFASGSVLHATGTREMSKLGGLWRAMPWTTAAFATGALAISGLPPFNGFVGEWLLYLGLFDAALARNPAAWAAIPAAILLGATGALALACFVKASGVTFLGAARSQRALHAHECGPLMRGSMALLGAGCIVIGLAPAILWPALSRAIETWQPAWSASQPSPPLAALGNVNIAFAVAAAIGAVWLWSKSTKGMFRRAPTWDCGYAAPSPRMQYTAGAFSKTVTEWFAWFQRPARNEKPPIGPLPLAASYDERIPETVLEEIVEPAGGLMLCLYGIVRKFQRGRVQAYLLYVLAGLAALAVIVAAIGK
jgi:hydrogenase-4 component B